MATHSSTLAWKIPWTEEPGRLQSVRGVAKSQLKDIYLGKFHKYKNMGNNNDSDIIFTLDVIICW